MAVATKKSFAVDFSDMSGGCVSEEVEHPSRLFKNQISDDSIGFSLKKSGIVRQPGAVGLSASTTFIDHLRDIFSHQQFSGVENLYAVSGGYLYGVSVSDGSLTELFSMGSPSNEAWHCDAYGKKFICNGDSTIKIEGTTAYRVGIVAPSGASATASAGSGLPDGQYNVYVGYARTVDGVNVLYSKGESLGSVTLSGGNNRITITCPNSNDSQVNNKVVWIQSPNELIHYFFHETGDNTTVSFVISSSSEKETAIVYEYDAADNGPPPAITFIFYFANRLWGIVDNFIWYSDDGSFSVYNLEKWGAANFRRTAHKLTGIFSVGTNLFFNTEDGILALPGGDVNQQAVLIDPRWHFFNMRTVYPWNNGVIGVTNQGIRIFNGEKFTDFDLGYPIRSQIDKIYSCDAEYLPCGFVYRGNFRDEYHLMWRDPTISIPVNNIHAVLNLSSLLWIDHNQYNLAWEFRPISGNYATTFKSNNMLYIGQSHTYESKVYYESTNTTQFSNVYGRDGVLISSATNKESFIKTRHHIENINGIMEIEKIYCHSRNENPFTITVRSGENIRKSTGPITIPANQGTPAVFPIVFPVVFSSDSGDFSRKKMPPSFKTRSVYVEIRQNANDLNFKLLSLVLIGAVETNNYI